MALNGFETRITGTHGAGLFVQGIDMLQVNLGPRCNRYCVHCHLDAGPQRRQMMDWPVMEMVLEAAYQSGPQLVNLTGGAPELAPYFRRFVKADKRGFALQKPSGLVRVDKARARAYITKDKVSEKE